MFSPSYLTERGTLIVKDEDKQLNAFISIKQQKKECKRNKTLFIPYVIKRNIH